MTLYFTYESRDTLKSFLYISHCQNHHETESRTQPQILNKNLKIGPLHDPVTWYKITHAGTQVAQWDFQNKATRTSPP